jgi:hypothetical protein
VLFPLTGRNSTLHLHEEASTDPRTVNSDEGRGDVEGAIPAG